MSRIILDDGTFFIELRENNRKSPGLLKKRHKIGALDLGGHDCVGGFFQGGDRQWLVGITAPPGECGSHNCRIVGKSIVRMEAIVELWQSRHKVTKNIKA